MIRAYVFDLDGTLHDQEASEREALEKLFRADIRLEPMPSFTSFLRAWRNASEEYLSSSTKGNLSFDEKRSRRVIATLAQFNSEISESAAKDLFLKYTMHYEKSWRPYDDALHTLQALKTKFRLGIITNGDGAMQRGKIKACQLESFFEAILVSGEMDTAKPQRVIFDKCRAIFGLEADAMAYVGDRLETDAVAAKDAGWTGIWINRKHMPGSDEISHEIRVISKLEELLVS